MNNSISPQKAIDMTTLFRNEKDNIVNPNLIGQNILPLCETFGREIFDAILAEPGCVKMRIYSGLNTDLQLRSLIVAVNDKDEDILPSLTTDGLLDPGETIFIGEDGQACPPSCPPPSYLNP
jgi:hypothetical protein